MNDGFSELAKNDADVGRLSVRHFPRLRWPSGLRRASDDYVHAVGWEKLNGCPRLGDLRIRAWGL